MKHLPLIIFLLFSIISNAQKISIKINVSDLDKDAVLVLKPSYLRDYYEHPIEDSLTNSLTSKINMDRTSFYYPYYFEHKLENNLWENSKNFFIKNNNLNLNLKDFSSSFNVDIPEKQAYNSFFEAYLKEERKFNDFHGEMFLKYNFEFPEHIQDSINQWYTRNWMEEIHLLDTYISKDPKSVIALWKLIEKYEINKDYNYNNLLNKFDPYIKQSFPYKVLMNRINEYKMYANGKKFPTINNLKNLKNEPYSIKYSTNKYTLVDFWFHACKPCLLTFPSLKNIHEEYNVRGFEIIGISRDNTKYIQKWRKVVDENQLPWVNVLDENGIFTKNNQINVVPTNFLIDQEGIIIKRNISVEDLKTFLSKNL